MSRGFIYRAWDKKHKCLCKVRRLNLDSQMATITGKDYTRAVSFDEIVLEQSTGLQDTNGVEIYEGDILELYKNKQRYVESVKYNETNRQFEAVVDDFGVYDLMRFYTIKVIGNIHENPELLEVQE